MANNKTLLQNLFGGLKHEDKEELKSLLLAAEAKEEEKKDKEDEKLEASAEDKDDDKEEDKKVEASDDSKDDDKEEKAELSIESLVKLNKEHQIRIASLEAAIVKLTTGV